MKSVSDHLEWEGLRSIKIQFSSHMVGLMFVPKHFIAAALYTLLLLQLRRDMLFIAVSGVVLDGSTTSGHPLSQLACCHLSQCSSQGAASDPF